MGLCEILPQNELTAKSLVNKVKEMLGKEMIFRKEAEKAKSLVIVDAAKRLAQETLLLGLKNR